VRGRLTTLPVLTAQAVAVKVSLALKEAGMRGHGKDLDRARYAFAERITKRAFVVSFTRFSEAELREVYNAADEPDTVAAFIKDFELERYRQHAKRILLGFTVSTPAPLDDPQAALTDRIAQALKETAYAVRPR
jgi:hypothetical protein